MNLIIRRTQHQSLSQLSYNLELDLVCAAEELRIIAEHNLSRRFLFVDRERDRMFDDAQRAFDRSRTHNFFAARGAWLLYRDTISAIVHWLFATAAYTITVRDALSGTAISCPDLDALLACEEQIQTEFDRLAQTVQHALTFEVAQEQVLAPELPGDDRLPAPAALINPPQGY